MVNVSNDRHIANVAGVVHDCSYLLDCESDHEAVSVLANNLYESLALGGFSVANLIKD